MTTAARATFHAAKGAAPRELVHSIQYSSRDVAAHTKLKTRQSGQDNADDLHQRDLKAELIELERNARDKRNKESGGRVRAREDSRDDDERGGQKRLRLVDDATARLDADDADISEDKSEEEDDADSDDDEDETAELMRELEKIRKERAEEQARKESERLADEDKVRKDYLMKGNPLLNAQHVPGDFKIKRRWDDDVVFKNCAKGDEGQQKRFVNDTLRSDFHRKFMSKYIK
eukprot:Opistho-2@26714